MTVASRHRRWRVLALFAVFAIAAAGCGGTSGGGGGDDDDGADAGGPTTEAGTEGPTPGGSVVYGLEAETNQGFCLPEANLAISGIMVARTVYDTLTAPNAEGEIVGLLAESVESNATADVWTVRLRDGITFHDGTPLTADVVKNNIDAYRGEYKDAGGNPIRNPLLFRFVFLNIASVTVVDPLTVEIRTTTPWAALPAYLYSSGRLGIMAQAQLDDQETCDRELVGTGPFVFDEWVPNDHLTATKNPDYWLSDADGVQLPYLDEIEFRPITEAGQRLSALQAGEVQAIHESGGLYIEQIRAMADAGDANNTESEEYSEVNYVMLNTSKPPFDNPIARQAMAFAMDQEQLNQLRTNGINTIANGPFAPGEAGYTEDTGYPTFDLERAQDLVAQYEAETGLPFEFTLSGDAGPDETAENQIIQQFAEAAGASVTLRGSEQTQLINEAIAGDFQALNWRNHPGGEPDGQYVWWHSGLPTNFSRITDTEVDRLLDEGRAETDSDARRTIYEELNTHFGEQAYNLWQWWTIWAIATAPDVHGVIGPDLPDGSGPFPGFATGHPVAGMWVEQ